MIYDYSQRKTELSDPGIEILTLDTPQPLQATTERVPFQIHDLGAALTELDHSLKDRIKTIETARKNIDYIYITLEKKRFAETQRNYGLLLLKRHDKKKSQKELKEMSEEDRFLYEWNENDIKEKFILPKFCTLIEREIADYQKHKGKRGQGQRQLELLLSKPIKAVQEIYTEFNKRLEPIQSVRRWLDAEERLILANFNFRLEQYIKILNALISKTYYILPDNVSSKACLFDPTILGKVLYGNEEESMLYPKSLAPMTPISHISTTFPSVVGEIESTGENCKELSEDSTQPNTEKVEYDDTSITEEDSAPTDEIKETSIEEEVISETNAKETVPVVSTKINLIQPTKIEVQPIQLANSSTKFEISYDEVFDEASEKDTDDGWTH